MKEKLWSLLAAFVSRPAVANWLIRKSQWTPYFHLHGYMKRWWLFNRYSEVDSMEKVERRFKWLPSIRVHHILREDRAAHLHDHPWNARTIILKGSYVEEMEDGQVYVRRPGDTRPIRYGEYHHIRWVQPGGVYTLFFTWEYMGTWGFLVDGKKVPYKKYLEEHPERS